VAHHYPQIAHTTSTHTESLHTRGWRIAVQDDANCISQGSSYQIRRFLFPVIALHNMIFPSAGNFVPVLHLLCRAGITGIKSSYKINHDVYQSDSLEHLLAILAYFRLKNYAG
jgi:hypothetical protein